MRLITWIIIAFIVGVSCVAVPGMAQTTQPSTRPIVSIDINYADGTPFDNIIEPSILKAVQAALDALKPKAILLSAAWKNAKNGVCEFQPGDVVIVDKPITYHGPGFIGCRTGGCTFQYFDPKYKPLPGKFDPTAQGLAGVFAITAGTNAANETFTVQGINLKGSPNAKILLADRGNATILKCYSAPGTGGLADMGGADLLDAEQCSGYACANFIYTGHGVHNGKLVWRDNNALGDVNFPTNEHVLRTHNLDELDVDGGSIDGTGSLHGKDALTIHEIRKKGRIANLPVKGWATIGGLTPISPGDNTKSLVNNLTFSNVSFEPCIRADNDANFGKPNGARLYFLAGVNNFKWDGGSIVSKNDSPLINVTSDGSSSTRKAPTGTIANVTASGPKSFVGGNAAVGFTVSGNTFNGKAQ
jgi:hypothetical protein